MASPQSLPPAQPAFILRGHSAQIHALHFTHGNTRLLTGDADGWLVLWNLSHKRPVAVWKAHDNAILAVGSWGHDKILSHGRDHRLVVWQLPTDVEEQMEKILPVDATALAKQPWMLHVLPVNTLNFCSFAMCVDGMPPPQGFGKVIQNSKSTNPILVAVPNTVDSGGIDIYQLPSETRAAVIMADRTITTGMVMALSILAETSQIQVAAGYESGHTMVFVQNDPSANFQRLYCVQTHSQPVLSLAIAPSHDYYFTSSADAVIAKHPLPSARNIWKSDYKPLKVLQTKHSGQQGLHVRSDGRIFATAGWDARVRVYAAKSMKEVAVLKWHQVGCYATTFAAVEKPASTGLQTPDEVEDDHIATIDQNTVQDLDRSSSATTVQQRRDEKAQTTHWLAAGSKDGKVSLWDIY